MNSNVKLHLLELESNNQRKYKMKRIFLNIFMNRSKVFNFLNVKMKCLRCTFIYSPIKNEM